MTNQPLEMIHCFGYRGPNVFGALPGLLLRMRSDKDRSRRLKDALKDGAQFIGLIMAYLDVAATPTDDGYVITVHCTTSEPLFGVALAEYVVAGVNAQLREDEEWDRDTPLFDLQTQWRHDAVPVLALQLIAEARTRDLPVLYLADGQVQFGYGVRSWRFAPRQHRSVPPPQPPWEQLGRIPIYAVTGEQQRRAATERIAAELAAAGHTVRTVADADYAATVVALSDPTLEIAVFGLDSSAILRQGVAFDRCTQCVITDTASQRPPEAWNDDEWVRALGVPMLLSSNPALINLADERLQMLVPYAPLGVLAL